MDSFHNFSAPLWEIFVGNLLLFLCSLFYLIWWVVAYRPGSSGMSTTAGLYLSVALIAGMAAIASLSYGIYALALHSNGLPVKFIWIGVGVLFLAVLAVTIVGFHRIVTSELILIHIWTALLLSAVAVLQGAGRFGPGHTVALATLIGIATLVGLICYVLYYRLDEATSYWLGMIPLVVDGLVVMVFGAVLAMSQS